jgi:hypothetical protein
MPVPKSPQLRKRAEIFLVQLAEGMSVRKARVIAGLGRSTVYEWKRDHAAFAQAWTDALIEGVEAVEDECHRRAVHGVDRPVYHGGKLVGHVTEYSDALLVMLLRGRAPEKYKHYNEAKVPFRAALPPQAAVEDLSALSVEELKRRYEEIVGAAAVAATATLPLLAPPAALDEQSSE